MTLQQQRQQEQPPQWGPCARPPTSCAGWCQVCCSGAQGYRPLRCASSRQLLAAGCLGMCSHTERRTSRLQRVRSCCESIPGCGVWVSLMGPRGKAVAVPLCSMRFAVCSYRAHRDPA